MPCEPGEQSPGKALCKLHIIVCSITLISVTYCAVHPRLAQGVTFCGLVILFLLCSCAERGGERAEAG